MTTRRPSRRSLSWLTVAAAAMAALAGVALGFWVDWTSPNPVYGLQVILLFLTGLVAIVGALVYRLGLVGRVLGTSSIALLIGSVAGLVVSPEAINYLGGTMTLRVDAPQSMVISGHAFCAENWLREELTVMGELGEAPAEGPAPLAVYFSAGNDSDGDPAWRDDGLALTISLQSAEGAGAESGAGPDSMLDYRPDGVSGTVRFAGLRHPSSAWADGPIDGTIEWTCRSE